MKTNQKTISDKVVIVSYILPLILQISLLIYQFVNKVISIWNIASTGMIILIFANAIRMSKNEKKTFQDPDIVTGGTTIDHDTQAPAKPSKKSIIIKIASCVACIALSILFFNIHSNKSRGLEIVNSTVISQYGETTIETEETDEGITQTETDHIEVIVEYEFNGTTKQAKITGGTTHKIHVDELKIYIDQNGKFVSDYGRILVWKIEAIIFLCAAIMLALITIFSLGIEFIAGTIFLFAGLALLFVVGCQFIENLWYNDLSCFMSMFINIGIYMLIVGVINLFLPEKQESQTKPISQEESMSNLKKRLKLKYNNNSQTDFKQKSDYLIKTYTCKNCGAAIPNSHKFCENCGTKKD